METDGVKHLIPLDKIRGGGPPKDGIPSIDNPVFVGSQMSPDSCLILILIVGVEMQWRDQGISSLYSGLA